MGRADSGKSSQFDTGLIWFIGGMALSTIHVLLGWAFFVIGVVWMARGRQDSAAWASMPAMRKRLFAALIVISAIVLVAATILQFMR